MVDCTPKHMAEIPADGYEAARGIVGMMMVWLLSLGDPLATAHALIRQKKSRLTDDDVAFIRRDTSATQRRLLLAACEFVEDELTLAINSGAVRAEDMKATTSKREEAARMVSIFANIINHEEA